MMAKTTPAGIQRKLRAERKRKKRRRLVTKAVVLVVVIFIFGLIINSALNQPRTGQPRDSSEPKAAIVDQLSLTCPNQTFIQMTTNTLKQAGYVVDYYPGEDVTVEFYRNLPTYHYDIVLLRVHSAGQEALGRGELALFTSEPYSNAKYVLEQLTDQVGIAMYSPDSKEKYFGIAPEFVTSSMNGRFQSTTIIMMGCDGLAGTQMAEAFIKKGAKVYISWNKSVLASQTDQATTRLLRHFLIEKQTINEAVTVTNKEVGPDPSYNSILVYYPLEAGNYTIQNIIGNVVTTVTEIQTMNPPPKTLSQHDEYVSVT